MFDFTSIKSKNLTRKQLLKEIKNSFYNNIKNDIDSMLNSTDIGKIFISCIPFDPSLPYILLDGRVLSKHEYPELYKIYGDNFRSDATESIPNENFFAIPNLNDLAIISQDELGQYDATARILGTNLPWRFPLDRFMDFDLSRVPLLAKNVTLASQSTNTNKPYCINQQGKEFYIVKKSRNLKYLPNNYSNDTEINVGDDLRFDSVKLLFYTKYK